MDPATLNASILTLEPIEKSTSCLRGMNIFAALFIGAYYCFAFYHEITTKFEINITSLVSCSFLLIYCIYNLIFQFKSLSWRMKSRITYVFTLIMLIVITCYLIVSIVSLYYFIKRRNNPDYNWNQFISATCLGLILDFQPLFFFLYAKEIRKA